MKPLSIIIASLCSLLPVAATRAAHITAGAGKAAIALTTDMFPIDGYNGLHDSLYVRTIIISGHTTATAIVIMDHTSISAALIADVKAIVQEHTGISPHGSVVIASHNFSSPSVASRSERNAAWQPRFEAAVLAAVSHSVAQAAGRLAPARLRYGSSTVRVAVNRDVDTPSGTWLGYNDGGFTDDHLGVMYIETLDARPVAALLNLAVQPSVTDKCTTSDGRKLISADLAGAAANHVEARLGANAVCGFIAGTAGNQSPIVQGSPYVYLTPDSAVRHNTHEAAYAMLDQLGRRVGSAAMQVIATAEAVQGENVRLLRYNVELPSRTDFGKTSITGPVQSYDYQLSGTTTPSPMIIINIGNLALVGMQPEGDAEVGANIRNASPYRHTIVASMADGAAKYLPTAMSYDRFTYEARNSFFAKGSAEILTSQTIDRLEEIIKTTNVKPVKQ